MTAMTFSPTLLSRDVLKLSGPDTLTLLQGLVTANVEGLQSGDARYGALLTPQGKIIETMFLTQSEEALYIDVPAGRGAGLMKKLMLYRLRAKVEIEDVSESIAAGASPDAASVPETAFLSAPDPRHEAMGLRWFAEVPADLPREEDDYLGHQAALGIPDMGAGFGEAEVFPLDVNFDVLHGIDHKKGCFVGQEVASRMFRKGEIRKRTFIAQGASLTPGTSLKQNDRTVGEVRYVLGEAALVQARMDRLDGDEAMAEDRQVKLIKPDYLP